VHEEEQCSQEDGMMPTSVGGRDAHNTGVASVEGHNIQCTMAGGKEPGSAENGDAPSSDTTPASGSPSEAHCEDTPQGPL